MPSPSKQALLKIMEVASACVGNQRPDLRDLCAWYTTPSKDLSIRAISGSHLELVVIGQFRLVRAAVVLDVTLPAPTRCTPLDDEGVSWVIDDKHWPGGYYAVPAFYTDGGATIVVPPASCHVKKLRMWADIAAGITGQPDSAITDSGIAADELTDEQALWMLLEGAATEPALETLDCLAALRYVAKCKAHIVINALYANFLRSGTGGYCTLLKECAKYVSSDWRKPTRS